MPQNHDLLGLEEAGRRLGVTRARVQQLVSAGQLPARLVGNRWLVAADDVERYHSRPRGRRRRRTATALTWFGTRVDLAAAAIEALDGTQAERVVRAAVLGYLRRHGLNPSAWHSGFDKTVADGGCDGILDLPADHKGQLPAGRSVWQVKAGNELPSPARELGAPSKKRLLQALGEGTTYVLVWTRNRPALRQEEIITNFNRTIQELAPGTRAHLLFGLDLASLVASQPALLASLTPIGALWTWEEWRQGHDMSPGYFLADQERNSIVQQIRGWARGTEERRPAGMFVSGRPGVGKTRLALEAFDDDGLRDEVLYARTEGDLSSDFVREIIDNRNARCVLVVDECSIVRFQYLEADSRRSGGRLRVLGIGRADALRTTTGGPRYVQLRPLHDVDLKGALSEVWGFDHQRAALVARSSQGFPGLANKLAEVLAGSQARSLAEALTAADPQRILRELVNGDEARLGLGVVALFTALGVEEEAREELPTVCSVLEISPTVVRRAMRQHRDLIASPGRFRQVTPQVVAAWLVLDLWHRFDDDLLHRLGMLPDNMLDRFLQQLASFGRSEELSEIADALITRLGGATVATAAFGRATLLRTLAAIAPERAADLLLQDSPHGSLHSPVDSDLLSTLKLLLWFPETFERAFQVVFALAVQEPLMGGATTSSEASTVLSGVFRVGLGGTAVDYDARLAALRSAVNREQSTAATFRAAEALLAGLSPQEFRAESGGQSGTLLPPEWRPSTVAEHHRIRAGVWNNFMDYVGDLQDQKLSQRLRDSLVDDFAAVLHVTPISAIASRIVPDQWSPSQRVRLRHQIGITLEFETLDAKSSRVMSGLHASLRPAEEFSDLLTHILSAEPHLLTGGRSDEHEFRADLNSLAEHIVSDNRCLLEAMNKASQAEVTTVGHLFEAVARVTAEREKTYEAVSSSRPVVPLAVAGFLCGRDQVGDTAWVTAKLRNLVEDRMTAPAFMGTLAALAPSAVRADIAIHAVRNGQLSASSIHALTTRFWLNALDEDRFLQLLEMASATADGTGREACLAVFDKWLDDHPTPSEMVVEAATDLLLRSLQLDYGIAFHRRRLVQRLPLTLEQRLAIVFGALQGTLGDSKRTKGSFREMPSADDISLLTDLLLDEPVATAQLLIQALVGEYSSGGGWSQLDLILQKHGWLSIAVGSAGVESMEALVGAVPPEHRHRLLAHLAYDTDVPDPLLVRLLERFPVQPMLDAATHHFMWPQRAWMGSRVPRLMDARRRAASWATSGEEVFRAWAKDLDRHLHREIAAENVRDAEGF